MDRLRDKHSVTTLALDLGAALRNSEYDALITVTFIVNETLVLEPDAWVHNRTKLRSSIRDDDYPTGVPDVAIVLHSPAARLEHTLCKIRAYLKCGTRNVWLVHPRDKIVFVFDPERPRPLIFSTGETLYLPEPMPQIGIPVEEIFRYWRR
jgi:Uma2 family endonuclease